MAVSRIDVLNREFSKSLRGYSTDEVDRFMQDVADAMARLSDDRLAFSNRIIQLEKRVREYEEREAALRETLIGTQRMANDIRDTAQRSGDEVRVIAQREGQLIVDSARSRAENILQQASVRLAKMLEEIAEAKKLKVQFELKVRATLEQHQRLLDMNSKDDDDLEIALSHFGRKDNG